MNSEVLSGDAELSELDDKEAEENGSVEDEPEKKS